MGILALITGLLPLALNVVQSIESIIGHGNGTVKAQAANAALGDVVNIVNTSTGKATITSEETAAIAQLVNAVVAVLNATGAFTHGTAK